MNRTSLILNTLLLLTDSLRHSSAISIILAVVFVAISSAMAISALCKGKTQKLRLFPDFTQASGFDLFTTIPVLVTSFGFHVNGESSRISHTSLKKSFEYNKVYF